MWNILKQSTQQIVGKFLQSTIRPDKMVVIIV